MCKILGDEYPFAGQGNFIGYQEAWKYKYQLDV